MRRLPSAHERLLVVKATCEFKLGKLARASAVVAGHISKAAAATVAGPGARLKQGRAGDDWPSSGQEGGELAADTSAPEGGWLQHAHGNIDALLGALNATSSSLVAVGMVGVGASPLKAARAEVEGSSRDTAVAAARGGKMAWSASPLRRGAPAVWSAPLRDQQTGV